MGANPEATLVANSLSDADVSRIAASVVASMQGSITNNGGNGNLLTRSAEAGQELQEVSRSTTPNLSPGDPISGQTIDLIRNTQGNVNRSGVNVATGYIGYDLKTPAATLVPFMTPLVNMTPRENGKGVPVHNWKAITDLFGGSGPQSDTPGVADGGTPTFVSRSVIPMANTFQTLAKLDSLTFQAEWRGTQLEGDMRAMVAAQLLVALKLVEENCLINWSDFLWTPAPILLSATNSGGTITNAVSTNMWFIITAVNANGETLGTQIQFIAIPGTTSSITLTIFTVPNATKYNVYAALSTAQPATSAMFLQSATTQFGGANNLNQPANPLAGSFTATMTVPASTGTTAYSTIVAAGNTAKVQKDVSGNILSWQGALSLIYNNAAAAVGTGAGGLKTNVIQPAAATGFLALSDVDTLLLNMYNNARAVPTHLFVSPQDSITFASLVASNGNTRIVVDGSNPNQQAELTAGIRVGQFLNKVTQTMVKIVPLPFLSQGTIIAGSYAFPYPISGYSNSPFRFILNREYYGVEYPPTLQNPMSWGYGDYVDSTVCNEFLGGWGAINGVVYH